MSRLMHGRCPRRRPTLAADWARPHACSAWSLLREQHPVLAARTKAPPRPKFSASSPIVDDATNNRHECTMKRRRRCYKGTDGSHELAMHAAMHPRCSPTWPLSAYANYRHALVPWCLGATVPRCHGATVPWCHGAMLPWCHGATVLWCHGALVPRCLGALVPWWHGAMAPRQCLSALVPWCHDAPVPWCRGATAPWRHGAAVPWCRGAMVPRCLASLVPWCLGAMAPRCQASLVPWCLCATVPWCHGACVPRCHGATVPVCHGATVLVCHGARVPRCLCADLPWCHSDCVTWCHGAAPPWCHGAKVPRGATRCVTPRQTCPRPNGFGRNLRSKTRWFTGFCNSHQVAPRCLGAMAPWCQAALVPRCTDIQLDKDTTMARRGHGARGRLSIQVFLGVFRAGVRWSPGVRAPGMGGGARAECRSTPPARTSQLLNTFTGSLCCAGFDNDPSAGSPTETLLRLLLPLNDKVQWTSRDVAGSEPPTSTRSEHFTGSFNR
ncbi:hypothetical protein BC332_33808 [Capsicum chinense]|nr:hypothetical protein BC332_33808 [Capsicum chinense]